MFLEGHTATTTQLVQVRTCPPLSVGGVALGVDPLLSLRGWRWVAGTTSQRVQVRAFLPRALPLTVGGG